MPTITNRCPNCGGQLNISNNLLSCSSCGTQILNIVDANVGLFEETISADEFAKKVRESRKAFVINTGEDANPNLSVFDIEKKVIRKHIQDAMHLLRSKDYAGVLNELSSIDSSIFSVQRLRFLADLHVVSEDELLWAKVDLEKNRYYNSLYELSDKDTKLAYKKISENCLANLNRSKEILEVKRLIDVKLFDDAILYASAMCKKYPFTAESWAYLYKSKLLKDKLYFNLREADIILMCDDCKKECATILGKCFTDMIDNRNLVKNLRNLKVGDTLSFGRVQEKRTLWKVIAVDDNKVLIVFDLFLINMNFDTNFYYPRSWETSTLRQYLNEKFYTESLTDFERSRILTTLLPKQTPEYHNNVAYNNTLDKVFIFSPSELEFLVPDKKNRTGGYCWLRHVASSIGTIAHVQQDGTISSSTVGSNYDSPNFHTMSIKPVMWLSQYTKTVDKYNEETVSKETIVDMNKELNRIKAIRDGKSNNLTHIVGDTIRFGTSNGEPIEWTVLSSSSNRVYLLSTKPICSLPFSNSNNSTWADSDIRKWLNSNFINTYFTQEERAKILPVSIPDKGATETNTIDKAYILSKDEVNALLPDESSRQCGSWWWLRSSISAKENSRLADYVHSSGKIFSPGAPESTKGGCVRPSICISV